MLRVPRRTIGAATIGAVALALAATSVAPAHADDHLNLPGDPTITAADQRQRGRRHVLPDLHEGLRRDDPRRHARLRLRARGHALDGTAPTGVAQPRPGLRPRPRATSSCRAPTRRPTDYTITQAQIDYLGDELANQIVAVDEEHFGPMDAADPGRPGQRLARHARLQRAGRRLLRLRRDTYTAGYFAPDYIDSAGHERHRHRRVRLGEPGRPDRLRTGATTTPTTTSPSCTRASSPTSSSTCCMNYSDPGELSWVDEGLADFAVFLNGYDIGRHPPDLPPGVPPRDLADPLGRRPGELRRRRTRFFQYLWEQAGGNGDGDLRRPT